jgi:hypothetical protein
VPPKEQRAYHRSYCTIACTKPQQDIPIFYDTGPYSTIGQPLNKPLIKKCIRAGTGEQAIIGSNEGLVCPHICKPYNAYAACVPEIMQTTSCGPISVCRFRPESDYCGKDCFIASMTCAAGQDVFFGIPSASPALGLRGLSRVARNTDPGCSGTMPFQLGDLRNELYRDPNHPDPAYRSPHLVCPICCPQGTEFEF